METIIPENITYLPEEIILIIATLSNIRTRRSMSCVSTLYHHAMTTWRDKTYGDIWFTKSQLDIVERLARCIDPIIHLKLPAGSGKTLITLAAAFGPTGFVRRGGTLYVCTTPSTICFWKEEIRKIYPQFTVFVEDDVIEEIINSQRHYDIILCTHVQLSQYISRDDHLIEYIVMDDIHHDIFYAYKILFKSHADLHSPLGNRTSSILRLIILSDQDIRYNSSDDQLAVLRPYIDRPLATVIEFYDSIVENITPRIVTHYHGYDILPASVSIEISQLDCYTQSKIEKCTQYLRYACDCTILSSSVSHHVVIFLTSCLPCISQKVVDKFPLILGYKMFFTCHNTTTMDAINTFEQFVGKAVLFLSYETASTAFSINCDEVLLTCDSQIPMTFVYEARRRFSSITSTKSIVHIHYISYSLLRAILLYNLSEVNSEIRLHHGFCKIVTERHMRDFVKVCDLAGITIMTTSPAIIVYLLHPTYAKKSMVNYYKKYVDDDLFTRRVEFARVYDYIT